MGIKKRWPKKIRKPLEKYKRKHFSKQVHNKKCSRCGKTKSKYHHFLCDKCYREKLKRFEEKYRKCAN
jgi:hypothetical protein